MNPHTNGNGNGNGRAAETDALRRSELADFLKARRAALMPADVGLPGGGRRRTPGLRREEVAQLAGVGTTWYTWLEQARDVRPSLSVLDAVASALKMSPAERGHLILLGRGEAPAPVPCRGERVSPVVRRLIDNLGLSPACVLGRRWDPLAYNEAYDAVFELSAWPAHKRNTVWRAFMDPTRRELMPDWELGARRMLARFRNDHAKYVGDPAFEDLVASLLRESPEFRRWWPEHEVMGSGEGHKELVHPVLGPMAFEHAVFHHGDNPEQRLILYTPLPDHGTAAKVEQLVAARAPAAAHS
jgi:transcriptional regulator with XRE-family HTH domain